MSWTHLISCTICYCQCKLLAFNLWTLAGLNFVLIVSIVNNLVHMVVDPLEFKNDIKDCCRCKKECNPTKTLKPKAHKSSYNQIQA